jgi:two-component system chemotaxis response regulator CheB
MDGTGYHCSKGADAPAGAFLVRTMGQHDIIVIGGSAGALPVLKQIVQGLPPDLPAAVFVVLRMSSAAPSHLAEILNAIGTLPATTARDGEPLVVS